MTYRNKYVLHTSSSSSSPTRLSKERANHNNQQNAKHCSEKFHIAKFTTNAHEVFTNPNVDIVFILTSDEFHEEYTILSLQAGKNVMVEKPLTLSLPSAQRILTAEQHAPNGARVFVGYMRRYAPSYTQTFKREIASIPRICYARVRDFSGPNSKFVNESGTFQVKDSPDIPSTAGRERQMRLERLFQEAFPDVEGPLHLTRQHEQYCRFLGSLGSHDISLLRETLGSPESVEGVSVNEPFYSAIFNYKNKSSSSSSSSSSSDSAGEPFSVTYESGIDAVPRFDAHLAVYGEKKRVHIQYDSPYIKGLPIKVVVEEVNEAGEFQTREMLGSYQDAYTTELQEVYAAFAEGKPIKTTVEDAMQDIAIFDSMYKAWSKSH